MKDKTMQRIPFLFLAQFAGVAFLPVLGGACSPSDSESESGGSSGAPGGAGTSAGTGGATGGSTSVGTGGSAAGAATGGGGTSPGTAGAATGGGGADATGGVGGFNQSGAGGGGSGGASSGCGTATFCDDFERSTMLGAEWILDNSVAANTIEVISTQHHSGMNAVHIKYGTGAMATYLDAAKGFPFTNDSFWGRVWMYAMTGLEAGHHIYIEAQSGPTNKSGVRVLNTQKMAFIATNLQSNDQTGLSAVTMPQAKWSCFEWQIKATGGTGEVHLYMDGTEVPGTTKSGWAIPHVDKTRLGIQRYGGGTAGELWYDDYAVGAERIGCN
jgi:hypothetical protein